MSRIVAAGMMLSLAALTACRSDELLLFFAGHGTTRLNRLDNVTVETGYLAPVEARSADQFAEMIDMEELLRKIGVLPARHILVILGSGAADVDRNGIVTFSELALYLQQLVGQAWLQQSGSPAQGRRRCAQGRYTRGGALPQGMRRRSCGRLRQTGYPLQERPRPCPRRSARGYKDGSGVPRDVTRANDLFRRACDAQAELGCAFLGDLYAKGNGLAADLPRAADLYRRACDAGDARGCAELGGMYQGGRGVPMDLPRGKGLYRKACNAANKTGCDKLARLPN